MRLSRLNALHFTLVAYPHSVTVINLATLLHQLLALKSLEILHSKRFLSAASVRKQASKRTISMGDFIDENSV